MYNLQTMWSILWYIGELENDDKHAAVDIMLTQMFLQSYPVNLVMPSELRAQCNIKLRKEGWSVQL